VNISGAGPLIELILSGGAMRAAALPA